jgi:hypothetical protein
VITRRSFALLALVSLSCGTATFVVQQYDGVPLDPSRISVLRVNGGTDVVVVALDGEELDYTQSDSDARAHIEMLPGVHEVEVGDLSDPLQRVVSVRFRAQAGKVYRLTLDRMGAGQSLRPWKALVWEVDRSSDRTLAVVPLLPPEGAASATSASASPPSAPTPSAPASAMQSAAAPPAEPAPVPSATATGATTSPPAPTASASPAPTSAAPVGSQPSGAL